MRRAPWAWVLAVCALAPMARAGEEHAAEQAALPQGDSLGTIERVYLPIEEMEILVASRREGIVLDYATYERLLQQAQQEAVRRSGLAPAGGVALSAKGTLDLRSGTDVRLAMAYRVLAMGEGGPLRLPFSLEGLSIEHWVLPPGVRFVAVGGEGALIVPAAGEYEVSLAAWLPVRDQGALRSIAFRVPPAAASVLRVELPPGTEGKVQGAGGLQTFKTAADAGRSIDVVPGADGAVSLAWAPLARVAEGPPILDADLTVLHVVGEGRDEVRAEISLSVFRTATPAIRLRVPASFSLLSLGGPGVARTLRSEDRTEILVEFDAPRIGSLSLVMEGDMPLPIGANVALPTFDVVEAARQRSTIALEPRVDVRVDSVRVEQGTRLPAAPNLPALRWRLAQATSSIHVDLVAREERVEAATTCYLNLSEMGKSVLFAGTLHVREGALHRLRMELPPGFELRTLEINGLTDGFVRDRREGGRLEVALAQGVVAPGTLLVRATLEQAAVDWLPDATAIEVPFVLPRFGVDREEGLLGIGADASFEVRETARRDLVPVGAAELTNQGMRAEGLVFGYRLDGAEPSVSYEVQRRAPLLAAELVTTLTPSPSHLDVTVVAIHDVRRAGVRKFWIDVPQWADATVRFDAEHLRAHARLENAEGVPAGYRRHEVVLGSRVVGRHSLMVHYRRDFGVEQWSLAADEPLLPHVPLERVERYVVVQRAAGLEVVLLRREIEGRARTLEATDLPREAPADPGGVLDVLHLDAAQHGLALAVRSHEGAAVLDALAAEVVLHTAVAREGILRTRAVVQIANVGRQQVEVLLPGESKLIGALVGPDGREWHPVKPLRSPAGGTLVPLRSRAGDVGASTWIALTYETNLGEPVGATLDVPAPSFRDLEVLRTTHRVALDPDVEVLGMAGDYGRSDPATRSIWIARFLGAFGGASSVDGGAPTIASQVPDSPGGSRPLDANKLPPSGPEMPGLEATGRNAPEAKPQGRPVGTPSASNAGGVVGARGVAGGGDGGAGREANGDEVTYGEDGTAGFSNDLDDPPAQSPPTEADAERDPGEGGLRPEADGRRGGTVGGLRRRGLLSLDVPVVGGPRQAMGARLGQGGVLTLHLSLEGDRERAYRLGLLLVVAASLLAARALRWGGWRLLATGAGLALLAHLVLAQEGNLLAVTLFDGTCLAVALRGLARFGKRFVAPRPIAAALVLAAWALAGGATSAAHAHEDDAPEPWRVFVPYDPESGGLGEEPKRVFLPLATYLHLERLASPHPERFLRPGWSRISIEGVRWHLEVDALEAGGQLEVEFEKEGPEGAWLDLPLAGVAVVEATLDDRPMRLELHEGRYRVPVDGPGRHLLRLDVRIPVLGATHGVRVLAFQSVPFPGARLELDLPGFDGETSVTGAGRVQQRAEGAAGARRDVVWLGADPRVHVVLARARALRAPTDVRMRAHSRTIHSLRDGDLESTVIWTFDVTQGRVPFVDLDLPPGCRVLEASGERVVRWEIVRDDGATEAVRVHFNAPSEGRIAALLRCVRPVPADERSEEGPEFRVRGASSEQGEVVLNAPPGRRVEILAEDNLHRLERPKDDVAKGGDRLGEVVGAWRFSMRPTRLAWRTFPAVPRTTLLEATRVVLGDDRVRTWMAVHVTVDRATLGELVFDVPGVDDVRHVDGPALLSWWIQGEGAARQVVCRLRDRSQGRLSFGFVLERRLGGRLDAIDVPRIGLVGAHGEQGRLVLFALPDVDVVPGALPGLAALPLVAGEVGASPIRGARPTHVFKRDRALASSLPLVLRRPEAVLDAAVTTLVVSGDREHRLQHLVVFDVLRGATERVEMFVPEGVAGEGEELQGRDVREVRRRAATRRGLDGADVRGTLYEVFFQSPQSGLITLAVDQVWDEAQTIQWLRPEGVGSVRWFTLVRAWIEGEVEVQHVAGRPEPIAFSDVAFVPDGLDDNVLVRRWVGREPYAYRVHTTRYELEKQAAAVVLAAEADVVLGLDGHARTRLTYRVFNRELQFLTVKLPAGAVLFGASSADVPIKPLEGGNGTLLFPVPKVPLGGRGYPVTLLFRTPAGGALVGGGSGEIQLPTLVGVEVERTLVHLYVPEGLDIELETRMHAATAADSRVELAEAATREVRQLLEVAEKGNLVQRQVALSNVGSLLDESRQLNDAGEARGKAASVAGEIEGLARNLESSRIALLNDLQQEAGDLDRARDASLSYASNASDVLADAVQLNRVQGPEDDRRGGRWRLNSAAAEQTEAGGGAPSGEAGGAAEYKKRVREVLEAQSELGAATEAMTMDSWGQVFRSQSGTDRMQTDAPLSAMSILDGQNEGRPMIAGQQVQWLNESLAVAQQAGRQLGATRSAAALGRIYLIQSPDGEPMDGRKAGLMGVDRELPRMGRVYHFVGLRAGAPIGVTASLPGGSVGGRLAIVAALAIAAFVAVRWLRRRRFASERGERLV